jgi:hypothetical protein
VNVLLTILTDSILAGVWAFVFSTVVITILGEILPQAYFSRHAGRIGSIFIPPISFWQITLYPLAKPTALLLDAWLGKEGVNFFKEDEIKLMLKKHAQSAMTEINHVEAIGAANFLALDDIRIEEEGEIIDPLSIVEFPVNQGKPVFPSFRRELEDPFLQKVNLSMKKWVIVVDSGQNPVMVLEANKFLRRVLSVNAPLPDPLRFCHVPLVIGKDCVNLGQIIPRFVVNPRNPDDDVIHQDILIYWGKEKRIITGADLLGRLPRGIVRQGPAGNETVIIRSPDLKNK